MAKATKPEMKEIPQNEKLELWKNRISVMKTYMANASSKKNWEKNLKYYMGQYKDALNLKKEIGVVVVNLVYAYVKTVVSELFARNPKFKANATNKKSILAAKIAEVVINYHWYKKKIKRQIKKCIKEAKLAGYSWIKTGYEGKFGAYEDGNEFIKEEDVYAVYVKHDAVVYDPEAIDPPYDCNWMYHMYPVATDKLNKKYPGKNIKSTSTIKYGDKKAPDLNPKDGEKTLVYEIWDKENEELLLYTDGYENNFLQEKKWVYEMDGFPFSMLTFDNMTDMETEDNLPEPDVNMFIDQVLEKMKFRSLQITHIKRFSRQMLADKSKIDQSEIDKYSKGTDGAIILVDGRPSDVVLPVAYAAIQPDIYAVENKIDQDMDRVSGYPGWRSGVSSPTKTRTLGELEELNRGAEGRIGEEQDIVEEVSEEVARKLLALMRQFYDKEQYSRIIGQLSPLEYKLFSKQEILEAGAVKWSGKDIRGEYDIEIVAGSTLPLNPTNRLNKLLSVARVGPAFGLVPGTMASMYLGKEVLNEMELMDVARAYDMDIQMALEPKKPSPKEQLELIGKKQQIDKNAVDTQLKKTRNEGQQLSNLNKAMKNADELSGRNKESKPKPEKKGSKE